MASRQVVETDVIYRQFSSGLPCWIADRAGVRRPLPVDRWLGGDASTADDRRIDEAILELCTGPTMDVGCGPGRFTAALAHRGIPALGVDVSATAVEMTLERGGKALHRDVFAPMPGCGEWSHVLLADGNIGIGGNPMSMLRRARQLLHPDGIVVAEIDALPSGVCTKYLRWETDHCVGKWFPWAHVGRDAASALADSAGFLLISALQISDRFVVAMRVA
ncbi:MAG TPA: methyltransferase domain-containing protein [Acidimicrobiales bacterium]|jgi:SAM-dependent methyltransferase|nr:methyltransferase domain-containing protein [Acidimicrobiales bacterium]